MLPNWQIFLITMLTIPGRSVVLIYDDSHCAEDFNEHFRPYAEQWGWPVINGWISAKGGDDQFCGGERALSQEGWVDYQAHGVVHNITIEP